MVSRVLSLVTPRKRLLVVLLGLVTLVLLPHAAWAHITVSPDTAKPGGYARLAFTVPNERQDADTVKVEVALPAEHPIGSVSVQPVPGWTTTVRKEKLAQPVKTDDGHAVTEAVSSIVWEGGQVKPGQFQQFMVSMGPLPKGSGTLAFKALQTYSDGSVVRWIDLPQPGTDPEHPAPTLKLAAPAPPAVAPEPSSDGVGRALGGAGLIAGLAALGWSVFGRRKPVVVQAAAEDKPAKIKVRA